VHLMDGGWLEAQANRSGHGVGTPQQLALSTDALPCSPRKVD
jgi:hypothetical protein